MARECPDWLAGADIWASEAQSGGERSWAAEAVAADIHRARGDGAVHARSVQSFLSAWQGVGPTGRGLALLSLYQLTGTAMWLTEARQLGCSAAGRWRAETDPFSLRKGSLGNALLMVELEAPERAILPVFGH